MIVNKIFLLIATQLFFFKTTSESMGKAGVEEFELDVHGARSKPRQASMSKRAAGAYQ